jgi:hypothetical protein
LKRVFPAEHKTSQRTKKKDILGKEDFSVLA